MRNLSLEGSHLGEDVNLKNAVGSVVEQVLLSLGSKNYDKITKMLAEKNITFENCYDRPEVLNFALKQLFGKAYTIPVDKIKHELRRYENEKDLDAFFTILSK